MSEREKELVMRVLLAMVDVLDSINPRDLPNSQWFERDREDVQTAYEGYRLYVMGKVPDL